MRDVWLELARDLDGPVIYWQLALLAASLAVAWGVGILLARHVDHRAPFSWSAGGPSRTLPPLVALVLLYVGELVLRQWQHTSLLTLAIPLVVSFALIRLGTQLLHYIFGQNTWLRVADMVITVVVLLALILHLTGLLPELLAALDGIGFSIGKDRVSLLLIIKALAIVIGTVLIAMWLSRSLENHLMRTQALDMNLRVVLTKLIRILITLIGVLAGLSAIGFDITLLSVFGGALGVGLGFGLQKIASNYVSGFILLLDESVHIGDVMTIDGHYGVVSQIRSRYLVLRQLDGTEVVIPNETLISNVVMNHSFSDRDTRVLLPVQVSYDSPLENAMALMREAGRQHPRVLADPPPETYILGFGESGIDLQLSVWITDPEEGTGSLKSAIYLEIWRAFERAGIGIPFPQRDIRIVGAAVPDKQ